MRASSDAIAQLAAAMAKAQSELVNPAKSLTAVLERGRNGSGAQSYRYAPLSSGLDIVRKTFGKYELAVIQTTHVDRERLLVHLTTTIAHSSGEWISALYPVCHLSDIGHPKLMGALLTYARRYCLFTMVGLAGEDDLDAPDLLTANAREVAGNGSDPETSLGGNRDINLERSSGASVAEEGAGNAAETSVAQDVEPPRRRRRVTRRTRPSANRPCSPMPAGGLRHALAMAPRIPLELKAPKHRRLSARPHDGTDSRHTREYPQRHRDEIFRPRKKARKSRLRPSSQQAIGIQPN